MAFNFEIVEQRTHQMNLTGSAKDKVTCTVNRDYAVELLGEATPEFVSSLDVLNAPGIPEPNRTIFKHEDGQSVVPFVLCRNVSATRDPNRLKRWNVRAQFKGEYEGGNPTFVGKQESAESYTPKVTSQIIEMERALYEDKEGNQYISPAGSWYDEPLVERIPMLQLTIEQYETSITYEDMLERSFVVNSATYRNQPPHTWLLEDVQATEVVLELTGGQSKVALVTYKVTYNPRTRLIAPDTWEPVGWKEDRTLVDTHYVALEDGEIKRKEFKDSEMSTMGLGQINDLGLRRHETFDAGSPQSIVFRSYEEINFNSFLQV